MIIKIRPGPNKFSLLNLEKLNVLNKKKHHFSVHLRSTLSHTSLKYRCPVKKCKLLRFSYLRSH